MRRVSIYLGWAHVDPRGGSTCLAPSEHAPGAPNLLMLSVSESPSVSQPLPPSMNVQRKSSCGGVREPES